MAERAIGAAAHVNVGGTCSVFDAAEEVGAQFVLVSSDKAASPRSVMGATKRFAEMAVLGARPCRRRPVVLRFGNVLASSGSFVEIMRERIRSGRSIQITDPDATRFFMSLGEAASLVMKAATIARGGEIFWLDMGDPIRIGDLAARLLELARRRGWPAAPLEIVGLRPGEKLAEQLTSHGIGMERTGHRRIWVARQPPAIDAAARLLLPALQRAASRDDAVTVLEILAKAVPDFVASEQAQSAARYGLPLPSPRWTGQPRAAAS
jgi:FlaA1/EpsC-like NDP-sugar epimerase